MNTYIEIKFWQFVRRSIFNHYGYCYDREGAVFGSKGRCPSCDASDVQDWVWKHIELTRK